MREIKKNGKILARHITPEDIKPGLISLTKDDEFLQVVDGEQASAVADRQFAEICEFCFGEKRHEFGRGHPGGVEHPGD